MNKSEEPAAGKTASLSALLDGETDACEVAALCEAWRRDERQRDDWHAYHLIGDVLRSEELAPDPVRAQAFLSALHERLAREPVRLLPPPTPAPGVSAAPSRSGAWRRRLPRRWVAPVGLAAGVVMVAGVVLSTRTESPGRTLAWWAPDHAAAAASAAERDSLAQAELLHYLQAHKEYPGTATLSPAAGYLRNAAYESAR